MFEKTTTTEGTAWANLPTYPPVIHHDDLLRLMRDRSTIVYTTFINGMKAGYEKAGQAYDDESLYEDYCTTEPMYYKLLFLANAGTKHESVEEATVLIIDMRSHDPKGQLFWADLAICLETEDHFATQVHVPVIMMENVNPKKKERLLAIADQAVRIERLAMPGSYRPLLTKV